MLRLSFGLTLNFLVTWLLLAGYHDWNLWPPAVLFHLEMRDATSRPTGVQALSFGSIPLVHVGNAAQPVAERPTPQIQASFTLLRFPSGLMW